jgi:predicted dehydrogenase
MKQVIQSARTGKLEVKQVPAPRVSPGHLLVRTRASLISAGTERMVVDFAKKSLAGKARARPDLVEKTLNKAKKDGVRATFQSVMARLDEPLPLGYSAAGIVTRVGAGLEGRFRVGERVAVAGAGLANHAEINSVPAALAAPIPEDVGDDEACYGTIGAIALHAVRNLDARLGDVVGVVGAGLVGQLALQLLALSGARAIAIDPDAARRQLALELGAEAAANPEDAAALAAAVSAMSRGLGCDSVLIAAATPSNAPMVTAGKIARDRAKICLVGLTGTDFPFGDFMKKELSMVVSRSYGPGRYDDDFERRGVKYPPGFVRWTETENLAEVLRLMRPGRTVRLDVTALTSHRFPLEQAPQAYDMMAAGEARPLGVVLTYREPGEAETTVTSFPAPTPRRKAGVCALGVIGAGNFARSVLFPELTKLAHVELRTLVTRRGATAEHDQGKYGFTRAETDENAVFADPEIDAVLIATRHDSHADLAARALRADKSVLVEKPLGLSRAEIETVAAARRDSMGFFQIGFNRRYAPMVAAARKHLEQSAGPKYLVLRVSAGAVAGDSWIQSGDEGGGRILGEGCHFVDLARFLVGAPIETVFAEAPRAGNGPADDVTATLRFADGSLATIAYTALGDPSYPKERFELFSGGTVIEIDDYRELSLTRDGRTSRSKAGARDKGFRDALTAFVDAVRAGGPAPIDEAELIETSVATVAILESLQTGGSVKL